nr:hypothetical protein Itr_chr09CG17950 [Ipomoea trifida]
MTTAESVRADDDMWRKLGEMTRAEETKANFDGGGGYGEQQHREWLQHTQSVDNI